MARASVASPVERMGQDGLRSAFRAGGFGGPGDGEKKDDRNLIENLGDKNVEGTKRRREFEEAIRNVVAKLGREGKDRIDRAYVEEIGQRYELYPDEASKLFVESRGNVWRGELIESEGEPGWEAATLERAPAAGKSPEDGGI